jgi:hypothetical protein
MMTAHTRPTLTSPHMPVVLALGCSGDLLERIRASASPFSAVTACDLAGAWEMIESCAPLVIIVTGSLFAFDPGKFVSIAQDARAQLVTLDEEDTALDALDAILSDAVSRARARRPPEREGRYSLVAQREPRSIPKPPARPVTMGETPKPPARPEMV